MTNIENNLFNGRVNLLTKEYPQYNMCPNSGSSDGYDIVSRTLEHTPVSSLFFSKKNIDALQIGICNRVFNESRGKYNIGRQSESELKIIMRSIYFSSLQNSFTNFQQNIQGNYNNMLNQINNNSSNNVIEQVRYLNKAVLDWAVPEILTNIRQFDKYKEDVSVLPEPIDRPTLTSMSGTKTLELQSFF